MRKVFFIMLIFSFTVFNASGYLAYSSAAAKATEIKINQVDVKEVSQKVYFNVTDENGINIEDVKKEQLKITLGEKGIGVKDLKLYKNCRAGTAYIFLIDTSRSINADKFGRALKLLERTAAGMGEGDQASVMTFGDRVRIVQEFTADKDKLLKTLKAVKPSDNNTQLYLGIEKAALMAKAEYTGVPDRHVIIAVSDGEEDYSGGITLQEAMKKIDEYRVPIYSVSFSKGAKSDKKVSFSKVMGSFARASGGRNYDLSELAPDEIYKSIKENISNCYEASLDLSDIKYDGKEYYLNIEIATPDTKISDGMNIRLTPGISNNKQVQKGKTEPGGKTVSTGAPITVQNSTTPSSVGSYNGPIMLEEENKGKADKGTAWYIYAGIILAAAAVFGVLFFILLRRRSRTAATKEYDIDIEPMTNMEAITGSLLASGGREHNDTKPGSGNSGEKGILIKLTEITSSGTGITHNIRIVKVSGATLGRDSKVSDIAFERDELLSGKHCRLYFDKGYVYVEDLSSTNGTFVNGIPIKTPYMLQNDDILLIGGMEYRITLS